ncbi:MAG: bifunctional [glutamate--ammonia ligase]-adenylyl-L-tyrosine phosphorylase/[glutamate--ammonia-ligase] adenylyltransferase, partial [Flexistipes sinusarabici]
MDISAVFTDEIKRSLGSKECKNLEYLCSHSELIAKFLLNHPAIIDYLYDNLNSERSVKTIFKRNEDLLKYSGKESDFLKSLRIMRMREYLLIAYKDLIEKRSVKDITANISSFASAALDAAYKKSYKDLTSQYGIPLDENNQECAFCIIGLGKLGGWELNFSSDVDIMFVYETEKGNTDGGSKGS